VEKTLCDEREREGTKEAASDLSLPTFDGVPPKIRVFSANIQRLLIVFAIVPNLGTIEAIPLLDSDALWGRTIKEYLLRVQRAHEDDVSLLPGGPVPSRRTALLTRQRNE
jgi:hypothetical protein